MRTWNSTAGWRKNSRAAALAAGGGLVLLLAAGAAGKEKAVDAPDMEMLEYLGTYETAGGNEIDPMLLNKAPKPGKARENERQPARKPAKPDKKKKTERDDE